MESKAASGDDHTAVATSPGPESSEAVAGEEAAAVSPPPPADASPRPYYECVFCKRGFTTAQALGGHMNIHRRDRAKPAARDSLGAGITSVSQNVECYNKYRHLLAPPPSSYPLQAQSLSSSSSPIPIGAAGTSSFGLYYVSSAGVAAAARLEAEVGSPSSVSPRELTLFSEANCKRDQDLHLGLGRRQEHVSRTPEDGGSSDQRQQSSEPPESELDLELRLGRRPMH
ncbi:unnamed protein product [Urochloa decumbens]|uniref:C2H2-type domain-containing protein n=1 Tax=Urochloa decumbens TaxID=240449 RepID=A0ABC8W7I2_9POAL